jgi:hypothetical protein
VVDQRIARHLEQPGARIVERAEILALLHRLNEHLLQQVVGKVHITGTVPEEVAQFVFVRIPIAKDARKRLHHRVTRISRDPKPDEPEPM